MVALSRLVVAAPSTGQGKTTVATGLMAALSAAGLAVSGHKVGPDYIDPGYHSLATGRPGRNLDPHLVGEERVVSLLLHGAAGADIAVIEGVMGLYDGRLGTDGFASTAHVTTLTRTPVVLVIDVARMSRTAAAIAAGMAAFDRAVRIGGVVLNRTGSHRNAAEIAAAVAKVGIPVLGMLPRDPNLSTPSRHLGLVTAAERQDSVELVERLGQQVNQHLDLPALLELARSAPELTAVPWDPKREVSSAGGNRPLIAVAGGRAFSFRYPETEELLRAAGCDVTTFDPLQDDSLPTGTRGIYLGGGFPEVYAGQLARNVPMLRDLREAVARGIPTVAECAGLLYLSRSLDDSPMAGALPVDAVMTQRSTLRYPVAQATANTLLTRPGEQVTGHEFHRTQATPPAGRTSAWLIDGVPTGYASDSLHASYLHVHWAGHPHLAQRFADAARRAAPFVCAREYVCPPQDVCTPQRTTASPPNVVPGEPLRHHGDAETGSGLLDLAVNVYCGERPSWLDDALRTSLAMVSAYPDPTPATEALARQHSRPSNEMLPTAGAAEAFSLIARLRHWRRPVVIHPQFTEPHVALEQAGHEVTSVLCQPDSGFQLDPAAVPQDADLVVLGNPTNPTGVLHPAALITALRREDRLLVVDEAFMDSVPGESESLLGKSHPDIVVIRSLTKQWSIPGIRAGYVAGPAAVVKEMAQHQTPWSVSTPAIAALCASATTQGAAESSTRASTIAQWRQSLEKALRNRNVAFIPSATSFILVRLGHGTHAALRANGVAVRRCDTFPGLDDTWVRIAVRPPAHMAQLFSALDRIHSS